MRAVKHEPLSVYLIKSLGTLDGKAWVMTVIASLVLLVDVLLSTKIFPLRDVADPGKALVLLLFTPLLVFLVMEVMKEMPFAHSKASEIFRGIACMFVFFAINF